MVYDGDMRASVVLVVLLVSGCIPGINSAPGSAGYSWQVNTLVDEYNHAGAALARIASVPDHIDELEAARKQAKDAFDAANTALDNITGLKQRGMWAEGVSYTVSVYPQSAAGPVTKTLDEAQLTTDLVAMRDRAQASDGDLATRLAAAFQAKADQDARDAEQAKQLAAQEEAQRRRDQAGGAG
jgi:hypothetical protein